MRLEPLIQFELNCRSACAWTTYAVSVRQVALRCLCPPVVGLEVGSMMRRLFALSSVLVLCATGAQQYAAFDACSASSTYSAGNLAGSPAFAAQQALSSGTGYWQHYLFLLALRVVLEATCVLQVLERQPRRRAERKAEIPSAERTRPCLRVHLCLNGACMLGRRLSKMCLCVCAIRGFCARCDVDRHCKLPPQGPWCQGRLGVCPRRREDPDVE